VQPPASRRQLLRQSTFEKNVMWALPMAMLLIGIINVPLALTNNVGERFGSWAYFGSASGCLLAMAMLVADRYLTKAYDPLYLRKVMWQCVRGGLILISWLVFLNVRAGLFLSGSENLKNSVEFSLLTLISILGFIWWNLMVQLRQKERSRAKSK
jgi:hypothetical protein